MCIFYNYSIVWYQVSICFNVHSLYVATNDEVRRRLFLLAEICVGAVERRNFPSRIGVYGLQLVSVDAALQRGAHDGELHFLLGQQAQQVRVLLLKRAQTLTLTGTGGAIMSNKRR